MQSRYDAFTVKAVQFVLSTMVIVGLLAFGWVML